MNKIFYHVLLFFICFLMIPSAAYAVEGNKSEEKGSGIIFEGKLYCSLRRTIVMPFTGVYTEVSVVPGLEVVKGDILAQYKLDEHRAIRLGREILFEELGDLKRYQEREELKVKDLERNEKELRQLTSENLSPKYLLAKLEKELELSRKYILFLKKKASYVESFEAKALEHMRNILGDSTLQSGDIPDVVKIKAPISGIVLSVHPNMRKDNLIPEGMVITQIGVMDTMLIRSLVYERDVVHLSLGDTVEFFPDSLPERSFPATVTAINWIPASSDPDSPSYYQVEMTTENKALELRAGFKGRIEHNLRSK